MDQEKKPTSGAPSSDTTSALFVSARKKQLEQQEVERRAKEKEDQRLAAEAEVRRLEQEVQERRRKAEEEARRVEEEAANRASAAQNPAPVSPPIAQAAAPQAQAPRASLPIALPAGFNKKLLPFIGGGAALVIILVVVLIVALSGGGRPVVALENSYDNSDNGFLLMHPKDWTLSYDDYRTVSFDVEAQNGTFGIYDLTEDVNTLMEQGYDLTTATEKLIKDIASPLYDGNISDMPEPELTKVGSYMTGSLSYDDGNLAGSLTLEIIEERMLCFMSFCESKSYKNFAITVDEVKMTLMVSAVALPPETVSPVVGEVYYEDGDINEISLRFNADGTVEYHDPEYNTTDVYSYTISGDTISVTMQESGVSMTLTVTIQEDGTLKDHTNTVFAKADASAAAAPVDDAPAGQRTFYDPDSGLKLYYSNTTEAVAGLTGDGSEIVSIVTNDGYYLIAFQATEYYNLSTETDDKKLSKLMGATIDAYTENLFGEYNGIVEGSVQNHGADLDTPGHSVALARIMCILDVGSKNVQCFAELTRVDANLIVLTITFTNPGSNAQTVLFNEVMHNMTYSPQ